jgi:hypothetical protein
MATNKVNPGANFEIIVDGKPRSYRDNLDIAVEAAKHLKSKSHGPGGDPGYSKQCSDTGTVDVGTAVVLERKKKLGARHVATGRHRVTHWPIFLRVCRRWLHRIVVRLWVSDGRLLRLGRLRFVWLQGHVR